MGGGKRSQRRSALRASTKNAASANASDELGDVRSSTVPAAGQKRKPPVVKASESDIMRAIESLYADELMPYGRILRKRLVEISINSGSGTIDVDPKHLFDTCMDSAFLKTETWSGGEWATVLTGREENFVDIYNCCDVYPEDFWRAAAVYFAGPEAEDMELPGGRYACAQALMERDLPFLHGFSLGRICHFVQLAISTKKVLGYLSGAVVPYDRSQSKLKESCAESQRPSDAALELPLATWNVVRGCLWAILDVARGNGQDHVPISNVKRVFRQEFQTELSETALGHAKLSKLLQDPRLEDICALELRQEGYVVVPHVPVVEHRIDDFNLIDELHEQISSEGSERGECQYTDGRDTPPLEEPAVEPMSARVLHRVAFCPDEPICLDGLEEEDDDAEPEQVASTQVPLSSSMLFGPSPYTAFFNGRSGTTPSRFPVPSPMPKSPYTQFYDGLSPATAFFELDRQCGASSQANMGVHPIQPLSLSTALFGINSYGLSLPPPPLHLPFGCEDVYGDVGLLAPPPNIPAPALMQPIPLSLPTSQTCPLSWDAMLQLAAAQEAFMVSQHAGVKHQAPTSADFPELCTAC